MKATKNLCSAGWAVVGFESWTAVLVAWWAMMQPTHRIHHPIFSHYFQIIFKLFSNYFQIIFKLSWCHHPRLLWFLCWTAADSPVWTGCRGSAWRPEWPREVTWIPCNKHWYMLLNKMSLRNGSGENPTDGQRQRGDPLPGMRCWCRGLLDRSTARYFYKRIKTSLHKPRGNLVENLFYE
jgi:hypothetical protein